MINKIKRFKEIIVVEEQWIDGGMGSLILEQLSINNLKNKVTRIGLKSRYYFENGGRDYLHETYGLGTKLLRKKIFK